MQTYKYESKPAVSEPVAPKYTLTYAQIKEEEGVYEYNPKCSLFVVVKEQKRDNLTNVLWVASGIVQPAQESCWSGTLFRKLPNAKVYLSIDTGEE